VSNRYAKYKTLKIEDLGGIPTHLCPTRETEKSRRLGASGHGIESPGSPPHVVHFLALGVPAQKGTAVFQVAGQITSPIEPAGPETDGPKTQLAEHATGPQTDKGGRQKGTGSEEHARDSKRSP